MNERIIKEKLFLADVSIKSIAEKFDCTTSNVHQLFKHKATKNGRPSLIREYIAKAISEDISIWY